MSFTTGQLDAIEKAIASGHLEIEHDGKRKKFRSMKELLMARDVIRRALGLSSSKGVTVLSIFNKGL